MSGCHRRDLSDPNWKSLFLRLKIQIQISNCKFMILPNFINFVLIFFKTLWFKHYHLRIFLQKGLPDRYR